MVVITGTGRCGTTFLIQLLTNLGLNTGWSKDEAHDEFYRINGVRGGIEHPIEGKRIKVAEYVKSPDFLFEWEVFDLYPVERVIIPIRELQRVANSREYQDKHAHGKYGGFHRGMTTKEQHILAYASQIFAFIKFLEEREIPYTLISFDKMMSDWEYLYSKIDLPLNSEVFEREYSALVNPEFIRF